jgi:C1A family cysteine protease
LTQLDDAARNVDEIRPYGTIHGQLLAHEKENTMNAEFGNLGMGWLPDYPDFRDYTPEHEVIQPLLKQTKIGGGEKAVQLLPSQDLRPWCSTIENQLNLGSCTANAGVGLMEYFERRAFGRWIDMSRLFLYKATRNLLHWTGDTGAFLRTTMGAMVLFGVPPEEYWPYVVANYEMEPSAFLYSFAENYKAIRYYRLDPPGTDREVLLTTIKTYMSSFLPSMFGFTVYSSISQASSTGKIPMPATGERIMGGHAVVAVGYDDSIQIKNSAPGSPTSKGALLIRNSWGPTWGPLGGYLWLPYDYVRRSLATDWWSLIQATWVNTGQFA